MSIAKLTLSVDQDVIREAKASATARHTSVSALFARLLRAVSTSGSVNLGNSPITRRATGLVTLPSDKNDTELLADALGAKYGAAPR